MKLLLIFVGAIALCYGGALSDIANKSEQRFTAVNFYLYTQQSHRKPVPLDSINIDFDKPFAVIVHGFRGHQVGGPAVFNNVVKDAFLTRNDVNVIVMDWSLFITMNYETVIALSPIIAGSLTDYIEELDNKKKSLQDNVTPPSVLPPSVLETLHLVGFDVGAHIVGIVGRALDGKVARITGLDPAATGWGVNTLRLRSTDAKYVEVIHTDSTGTTALGLLDELGNADFYPNGGTRQTGCATNLCNHDRAWELFAASLTHPDVLKGYRCQTIVQMNSNTCISFPQSAMGNNDIEKFAFGIIRVNTGRIYPYNL